MAKIRPESLWSLLPNGAGADRQQELRKWAIEKAMVLVPSMGDVGEVIPLAAQYEAFVLGKPAAKKKSKKK